MARNYASIGMAAALLVPSLVPASSEAPSEPAKSQTPAAQTDDAAGAEKLAECLRRIRDAKDPADALSAYARACSLAPDDPAVRDAHMRRMLQFGKPDIAVPPARVLLRLQPAHPLARAVVGYWHCKRKEWSQGLIETVLALTGMDRDPGVLNNAGQLVAWHEAQPKRKELPKRAQEILSEKRSRLMGKPKFAEAHRKVKAFFDKQAGIAKDFDDKIAKTEGELQEMRKELRQIDSRIASLKDKVRDHKREMYRLKRSLPDRRDRRDRRDREEDRRRRWDRWEEQRTWDRIHEQERAIDRLEAAIRKEFLDGAPKLKAYRAKQGALRKLNQDKVKAMGGLERVFRWDPPGVDGVVTVVSDAPLAGSSKTAPPSVDRKPGEEGEAQRLLKLVKTYRASGMRGKALTLLQKLVAAYPASAAGKEAMQIIQDMADE